jgi:phenylpropionate dioxygenase-like ring-hydroxylating dioxygenase large terminal subunit
MFEGFANVWTPVELARRLGRRPLRVRVAGQQVVLFRGEGGRPGALLDRCPHRGAALSLGRVVDGCVECPFHGWRFSPEGACRAVPLNDVPQARRERLGATALPVRERAGLLWLYTRPGTAAEDEPQVSEVLADATLVHWLGSATWRMHWSRAMENALDFAHLPFVHRHSIGLRFRRDVRSGATMALSVEPTATGMRIHSRLEGVRARHVPAALEFVRPNGMRLCVTERREERWLHLWCVPQDDGHTRILMATMQRSGRYNPLRPLLNLFNQFVILEDQRVGESIQPSEVPQPQAEVHVATDRPTLLFRRYYHQVLRPSSAPGAQERLPAPRPRVAGVPRLGVEEGIPFET